MITIHLSRFLALLFLAFSIVSCAHHHDHHSATHRTTTTVNKDPVVSTTTVNSDDVVIDDGDVDNINDDPETVTVVNEGSGKTKVVKKTVVTEKEEEPHRGFIGTTLHIIGQIITLPFKLVGGLFRAIF